MCLQKLVFLNLPGNAENLKSEKGVNVFMEDKNTEENLETEDSSESNFGISVEKRT